MIEGLISQYEAVEAAKERFIKNRNSDYGLLGHDTGVHEINLMIGGWISKKVTTIAGRSGMGKTALTTPMIKAGARVLNNRRCAFMFCSWEMSGDYIVDRQVCNETGLSSLMLSQGAKLLSEKRYREVELAFDKARKAPVHYQPMSIDIDHVRRLFQMFCEQCYIQSNKEKIEIHPVLIVDYVGMAKFEGNGLRTYGIAEFMNGIKQMVNETGGSACILAQIGRGADEKDIPQKSDLSDSKSIEDASDNLILAHRPEYNNVRTIINPDTGIEEDSRGKMLIRTAKGRDFGTGDKLINCSMKNYRFWSLEHEYDTPYWELYSNKDFWINHFNLNNNEE